MALQLFGKKNSASIPMSGDFWYLTPDTYYFDAACQSLRPKPVMDAESEYYQKYNACGGRVKYPWGMKVDEKVTETRELLLDFVGVHAKHYTVAFTLNATYGINLVLQQLPAQDFKSVITSELEHNSVFLPTMIFAEQHGLPRIVLERADDGSLLYQPEQLDHAIVVVNTMSNIDGRRLENLKQLAEDVHARGGVLLLDACQTLAHSPEMLHGVHFDALFASGHKLYASSCGFIIIRHDLVSRLQFFLLGGGTVADVEQSSYELLSTNAEPFARLELGLQNYGAIIGLGAALQWLKKNKHRHEKEQQLAEMLFIGLKKIPGVILLNDKISPVVALYSERVDSHRLAMYLGEQNIMCRSGYFCCHYYLKNKRKLPPLLRISLGLHNTPEQIQFLLQKLEYLLTVVT